MTLPACAAERDASAVDRYLLPAPALSSKPAVAAVGRWDRQTDGRTPDRYVDPVPHTVCR